MVVVPTPAATTWKASSGPSKSSAYRSPLAVGVPGVPLLIPPASMTVPVAVPLISAAR